MDKSRSLNDNNKLTLKTGRNHLMYSNVFFYSITNFTGKHRDAGCTNEFPISAILAEYKLCPTDKIIFSNSTLSPTI